MGTRIVGPRAHRGAAVRAPRSDRAGIARMHGSLRLGCADHRRPSAGGGGGAGRERPDRDRGARRLPAMALQAGARGCVGRSGRGCHARGGRLPQSALPVHCLAHACRAHARTAAHRLPVRPLPAPGELAAAARRRVASIVRRAVSLAATVALAWLASACAVAEIDRYMLRSATAPVRLEGAGGVLTRAQSQSILEGLKKRSPETSIFDRHVAVEEAIAGNALSVGNRVQLLEDGARTYASMLAAIKAARHSVHMETYIFEADEVGNRFAAALAERARAGVKVKVLYDSVGSAKTPKEFFNDLAAKGVEVEEF